MKLLRGSSDQEYVDCLRRFRRWRRWIAAVFFFLGSVLLLLSFWLFVSAVLPGFSLANRDDQLATVYPEAFSKRTHYATFFVGTLAGGVLGFGTVIGIVSLAYGLSLFVGSRTEQLLLSHWDRIPRTDSGR